MTTATDPTFYRSPAEAMAAAPGRLAYAVAYHPSRAEPDALTVVDVDPDSSRYGQVVGGWTCPPAVTSCTTSGGTPAC